MPIYEYDCPKCGRFEVIQKFSDKELKKCPQCAEKGKESPVERAVSASSFHLKGSGWYKTDYTSSSSSGGKSSPKPISESSSGDKSEASSSDSKSTDSGSSSTPKKGPCGSGCGCH